MKILICILLTFVATMPSAGLAVPRPTHDEVTNALSEASALFMRFEQVTDRINFGRWTTAYGVSQNAKQQLDYERSRIRELKPLLETLRASDNPSALGLLDILDEVHAVNLDAKAMSYEAIDPYDFHLAADLAEIPNTGVLVAAKIYLVLNKVLAAQQVELVVCRQRTH